MGYGFIVFNTEETAKKAVEQMDKKELDGRVVNCEISLSADQLRERREAIPERPARGAYRGRGGRGRGGRGGRGRRNFAVRLLFS